MGNDGSWRGKRATQVTPSVVEEEEEEEEEGDCEAPKTAGLVMEIEGGDAGIGRPFNINVGSVSPFSPERPPRGIDWGPG